jgi:CheY-like chemotaxis protein/prolyl-tRNA editing enzyme YbaK/EbsC (Cys-tRNA(Pro) deacylase)
LAVPHWLKRILQHYGVPFEERHHPRTWSASHLAHAEHISGRHVAKTVVLALRGRPLSIVLPAAALVDLGRVADVVGGSDLRFASEAEIARWFKGCQPGSVPPLKLRAGHHVIMDRSFARLGKMLFPAGTQEDAVIVQFRDWWRMVQPGVGRFALLFHAEAAPVRPTVLVVEDEHDTNDLFCRLLEKAGFDCFAAEAGQQALSMAARVRPSAVLLDLMLPDMSGFDVYERMRCPGSLRRPPAVIVSALDDEASRQRGASLGADAFLTKPFLPQTVVTELRSILADARAR